MIEAKEYQRELLAEKRLSQMAETDAVRREAIELSQAETARRNAELREYQSLRMQSIRRHQVNVHADLTFSVADSMSHCLARRRGFSVSSELSLKTNRRPHRLSWQLQRK